jgi:polysaccharide deacetylase 2 family uncharacterized protein YibQ
LTAPDDAPNRRQGGRIFLALALGLLLGAAAGAAWLHYTDRLEPLLSGVPMVEAELPPRQAQTASEPASEPATGEATAAAEATVETTTETTAEAATAPDATAEAPAEMVAAVPADATGATVAGTAASEPAVAATPDETAATVEPSAPAAPAAPADAGTQPAPTTEAASAESPPAPSPEPAPAEGETAASAATEPVPAEATASGGSPTAATTELAAVAPPPAPGPEPSLAPPWKRYARPFPAGDTRPRIAIVIAELGLSRAATEAAIERLPPEITLAFNPLAPNLQAWIIKARARGHEVMLDLPMEPLTYPQEDPGPHALMASLDPIENARRLEFLLDRADGYVGVATYMGSRFEGSAELIEPVLQTLAERGLLFLANRSAPATEVPELAAPLNLALISNDRFLDTEATRVAIDGRLQQLERLARTNKGAVAMGLGYPVTIERVGAWAETLGAKGIALAPASALVGVAAP